MENLSEMPLFDLYDDEDERPTAALVLIPPATVSPRYEETYVEPVRRLNATLNDVLDVTTHPDRTPAEALNLLKSAMETFTVESEDWFEPSMEPARDPRR